VSDGIGDAILVLGEEAPGQALRLSYNTLQAAVRGFSKTDYVACLLADEHCLICNHDGENQGSDVASQGSKDCDHGVHCERPGEMADADFWLCRRCAGK